MTTGTRLDAVNAELAAIDARRRKLAERARLLKMEQRALEAERIVEEQRERIAELEAAGTAMVAKAVEAEKVAALRQERIDELEGRSDRRRLRAVPEHVAVDREAHDPGAPPLDSSSTRGSPDTAGHREHVAPN